MLELSSRIKGFLILAGVLTLVWACEKESEENLNGGSTKNCEVSDVSYANQVQPIFTESCAFSGCHAGSSADFSAGIDLSSYEKTQQTADSDLLIRSIKHEQGVSSMPRGAAKLDACKIATIETWINEGRQDN